MKRCLVILSIGLLCFSFSTACAQNLKGKFALTGVGGFNTPIGDFADEEKGAAKSGIGFGGNLEYFISDNFSLGGNFTYRDFGVKTEDAEEEFRAALQSLIQDDFPGATVTADLEADHKVTSFGVFGKYLIPTNSKLSPYLKAGVGMGKLKSSADVSGSVYYLNDQAGYGASADADFDSEVYLDIGGGLLCLLSDNVALTGEVVFSHLMTDEAEGEAETEFNLSYQGDSFGWTEKENVQLDHNSDYVGVFLGLTVFLSGRK